MPASQDHERGKEAMGRSFGILALGLCLTGCATNNLDNRLGDLVGQDIHEAFAWLGPAEGNETLTGGENYVWTIGYEVESEVTQTGGAQNMGDTVAGIIHPTGNTV